MKILLKITAFILFSNLNYSYAENKSVNYFLHNVEEAVSLVAAGKKSYEAEVARLSAVDINKMIAFVNADTPINNASKAMSKLNEAFEFKKPLSKCYSNKNYLKIKNNEINKKCLEELGVKL